MDNPKLHIQYYRHSETCYARSDNFPGKLGAGSHEDTAMQSLIRSVAGIRKDDYGPVSKNVFKNYGVCPIMPKWVTVV